jgi:hypothetical protein
VTRYFTGPSPTTALPSTSLNSRLSSRSWGLGSPHPMSEAPASIPPVDANLEVTRRYLPWVVAVALFMQQLDSTIVNTAVPTMAESLGVASLSLKSVLTSYTIAIAVLIPAQRLAGGQVRHPPRVRLRGRGVHPRLPRLRALDEPPDAGRLADPPRRRRGLHDAGRPDRAAQDLPEVRHPAGDGIS